MHHIPDDRVLAVVEAELTDDNIRVVVRESFGDVQSGGVFLSRALGKSLFTLVNQLFASELMSERERLLDGQQREVLIALRCVGYQLR
ncbi:hypothetical protein PC116_g23441 [Phytophthora cactorum]|nr:hypothetical protein PC116_g23441 [Phytophthora cactorum]